MLIKLITILFSLPICFTFDLPQKCLYDLKINNENYNVSEVYEVGEGNVYPTHAHYDVYGNLFYIEKTHNNEGFTFDISILKFNSTVPQKIPGLPGGISYSIAIDKKQTKVYFGTGKGIYAYNYETHTASPMFNNTLKLDMIFVDSKNSNKYIIESVNGIDEFYLLDGDKKIPCYTLEAFNEMAVDEENNFYFIRQGKLYVLQFTGSTPLYIGNVTYQGMAQITFYNNNVFVASDKLAYFHENDTTGYFKVVHNVPANVTAIAFDNTGNFILGVQGKILKYKKNECYSRKSRVIDDYEYNIN